MFHLQYDQRTERCIPLYRVQDCYTKDSVTVVFDFCFVKSVPFNCTSEEFVNGICVRTVCEIMQYTCQYRVESSKYNVDEIHSCL